MISAAEARTIIRSALHPLKPIRVGLRRARGLVLAEDVVSVRDIPPFDNSAMDGFALRSADVVQAPSELDVIGEIAAGAAGTVAVQPHSAISIMTGGMLPEGADAVIQQEWTEPLAGGSRVKILRPVAPGQNIRRAGNDIRTGATVLECGTLLRAQEIALLASVGKGFVSVHRPPAVAVLATGNEIVEIDKPLGGGKIYNSNAYALLSLAEAEGAVTTYLGIAPDTRDGLLEKIRKGLASADLLITTGGVSVGKYDLVMDVLKELGVEVRFWKVNIKPGMPLLFGMRGTTAVFGLPGNPVSTMVTFLQFVRPALRALMGVHERDIAPLRLRAVAAHEFRKEDAKRHFLRGIAENVNGTLSVRSTGSQVSNILSSLVQANCLIILPEDVACIREGEEVEIELL